MGKGLPVIVLICAFVAAQINSALGVNIEQALGGNVSMDVDKSLEKLEIYFETEMYDEAALLLDELIFQYPDEPRFKYLQAIVDYQRQDFERASKVFVEFIEQYPEVAEPYYLLGEIALSQNNCEKARRYLAKYCELVPEDYAAHRKLESIFSLRENSASIIVIKDGREDSDSVKKVGFYGACVSQAQEQSIKLINGSYCNWSSMGIDFSYPMDLRGKQIVLQLKGKQGGEKLQLTFRDKFAQGYTPQLIVSPVERCLSSDWQKITVFLGDEHPEIDLSNVVHMGLEFGSSTVQNPANSALFVKYIFIEPH